MTFVLPPKDDSPARRGASEKAATGASPKATGQDAWFRSASQGETLTLELGGQWTARGLGATGQAFREIEPRHHSRLQLDLTAVRLLDTTGAWIIHATKKRLERGGTAVGLTGAGEPLAAMLTTVETHDTHCPPAPARPNALVACVARLGGGVVETVSNGFALLSFMGLVFVACLRALVMPWRLRWVALANQIEEAGLNALPIVALINFLFGVVIAFLSAAQLANFGAQILTVNVVAVGVLREMAIVLTAIIIAGRSGSAFTAQIGTMKVNEEIDALQTIGLDPVEVLVVPRVLGLSAGAAAAGGSSPMSWAFSAARSWPRLQRSISRCCSSCASSKTRRPCRTSLVGLVKAPLFAIDYRRGRLLRGFQGLAQRRVGGAADDPLGGRLASPW